MRACKKSLRLCYESAANGIGVNVLDFRVNGLWFIQVPVVPSPALPKPIRHKSVGLLIEHQGQ